MCMEIFCAWSAYLDPPKGLSKCGYKPCAIRLHTVNMLGTNPYSLNLKPCWLSYRLHFVQTQGYPQLSSSSTDKCCLRLRMNSVGLPVAPCRTVSMYMRSLWTRTWLHPSNFNLISGTSAPASGQLLVCAVVLESGYEH